MALHIILLVFACLIARASVKALLTLNESFYNLDNWIEDINGYTGNITLLDDHQVFLNVSYCGGSTCYRAELAVVQSLRPTVIPNCSTEYWLGMSSFIPTSWIYSPPPNGVDDVLYNFQLHGGDNEGNSPNLGIRIEKDEITVNICGNTEFNSNQSICQYFSLGPPTIGGWMDWVVHSQLAYGEPTGFVTIWRNGVQMLSVKNLLTAYDDSDPPFVKVGSYQINWKDGQTVGYDWMGIYYKAVRVGNANSNYDEVYTGTGTPCGSPCETSSGGENWSRMELMYWLVIPTGLVVLFSIVLYMGSTQNKPPPLSAPIMLSNLVDSTSSHKDDASSQSKRLSYSTGKSHLSLLSMTLRYSYGNFVHKDEDSWEHRELGWFRSQSIPRKIFWYSFAALWTSGMMLFAVLLYGRPAKHSSGLLPWQHVNNWTPIQGTLVVITITMMTIYFLPLGYLKHDFNAGKAFKNDPKFLKRIGVIIPCHKSAGEIGEVINRVLKYIPPENIVVCDNGNFEWPPDNTFEVVKNINKKILYVYIKQGHKTRALWTGVHRLPSHVDYVIHLDDDTHFSDAMVFDEKHFKDKKCIAVAFLRSSYPINTVTQFTDFWYKITDHFHATQARICTRCFVPGPAGMWRRDKFIEIFGAHPSLPFGEDIFGGFTLLNKGYKIGVEIRCMVKTFAPPILVPWFISGSGRQQGYGASSLWKQRAHRWTVSALRITGKSLYSFLTYNTETGIATNIAFRLYRFREYKIILVQLLYVPLCLVIIARGFYLELLIFKLILFVVPFLRNLCINYIFWRGQPELQVDFRTVCLSPFFNFFLICCAIHGRWKCLLWYLPNVAPNHGMLQRCRPAPMREVVCEYNPTTSTASSAIPLQVEDGTEEDEGDKSEVASSAQDDSACDSTNSRERAVVEQSVDDPYHAAIVEAEEHKRQNSVTRNSSTINALHDGTRTSMDGGVCKSGEDGGAALKDVELSSNNNTEAKDKNDSRKTRPAPRPLSTAERVIREFPNSFELFEREGRSRIVNYHFNPA